MVEFTMNLLVQDSMGETSNELVFGVLLQSVEDHLDGLQPVLGAQNMVRANYYITNAACTKIEQEQ